MTLIQRYSSCCSSPEEPRAICPVTEIEAKEGDDVILPFYVVPPVNLSAFTVDWSRTNPSVVVYSYRHQQELHNAEMDATVRREDLNRGSLTLWIPSVQMSHSGEYTGFVMELRIKCSVQLNGKDLSNSLLSDVLDMNVMKKST